MSDFYLYQFRLSYLRRRIIRLFDQKDIAARQSILEHSLSGAGKSPVLYIMRNLADPNPNMRKFGRSKNVEARLRTYRTGAPRAVIEYTIPCVDEVICERLVKRLLHKYRVPNTKEWFETEQARIIAVMRAVVCCIDNLMRGADFIFDFHIEQQVEHLFGQISNDGI